MSHRSASHQHQQLSRPIKTHPAWSRLVDTLRTEMSEEEITSLALETVKDLARHCGLDAPLDVAHVELAWGERQQLSANPQPLGGVWHPSSNAGGQQQQQHQDPYAAPHFRDEQQQSAHPMGNGAPAAAPTATASRKPLASKPAATGLKSKTATVPPRGRSASPTNPPPPPAPAAKGVTFNKNASASATAAPSQDEQKPAQKLRPQNVASRIDTGAKRSKTPTSDADEVICIEDMKEVFTKYAAFANGNPKEIDSSRFAKMCKECDFVDKMFTLRDADVLFMKCKKSPADRRLPYHVFRMKLIPELASKKHKSIQDVVKLCNHHGGPRTKAGSAASSQIRTPSPQNKNQSQQQQQYYEDEEEEALYDPPAPPPPQVSVSKASPSKTTPRGAAGSSAVKASPVSKR